MIRPVLVQEYKRIFTLAWFNEIIVQEIPNFFPKIFLFCGVHSVWMLFYRL